MSIFTKIFRRKKKEIPEEEIKPVPPTPEVSETRMITMENLKARLDLVLAELDTIKTQNQTINERLKMMEKILNDMKGIKYY